MEYKSIVLAFLISLVVAHAHAQTIACDSAKNYVGKNVTVCGKITSAHTSKEGIMFLNFGDKYPNQTFTVYIPASKTDGNTEANFTDKTVCVTGTIKLYKDKPEIQVSDLKQIDLR